MGIHRNVDLTLNTKIDLVTRKPPKYASYSTGSLTRAYLTTN